MANFRVRPNGIIQYDLHIFGVRFRETSKMPATPKNIRLAKSTVKQINAEIALGSFEYRDFFPHSKKVAKYEALQREKAPEHRYPYFDNYANEWLKRQAHRWKKTYLQTVRINLEKYLFPTFGNTLINEITLSQLEFFRQHLTEDVKEDGTQRLSNARINNIVGPLVAIVSLAAEELKFEYPFRCYKSLREEKGDSDPMTLEEVNRFLAAVDKRWFDYYLLRFYTGMRSCEIHGLQIKHINFEHRLIKIRQNWVNGDLSRVKTPRSRRDLKMCDTLFTSMKRIINGRTDPEAFLFTGLKGKPLDTRYISTKVWFPTLKKAGLRRRRPYETRHTSAVLHIAAHENPVYISHMLGHSSTKMLFNIYAPYVIDATRQDGSAFSNMMKGV